MIHRGGVSSKGETVTLRGPMAALKKPPSQDEAISNTVKNSFINGFHVVPKKKVPNKLQ